MGVLTFIMFLISVIIIVWLIINAVRKKPVKKLVIAFVVSVILFFVFGAINESNVDKFERGKTAYEKGKWKWAIRNFTQVDSTHPNFDEARKLLEKAETKFDLQLAKEIAEEQSKEEEKARAKKQKQQQQEMEAQIQKDAKKLQNPVIVAPSNSSPASLNQISPVDYEIVETKDQSHKALGKKSLSDYTTQEIRNLPIDKKMLYKIIVSPEIKVEQVRPTIQKIISDITANDNDIDEISLLLCSDKELAGSTYDVAMATWAPDGKLGNVTPEIARNNDRTSYETTIKVKENLEEYLLKRGKSENKFGFDEEKRRQIFKEFVAAEDKARIEADKIYPTDISDPNYKQENIMKNIEENRKLMEKYKAKIRKKYGITEDIESQISAEAFEEGWAMK